MSFTIEVSPDEPILMITMDKTFNVASDLNNFIGQVTQALDAADQPMFYVADARGLKVGFEDLVSAASTVTRGADAFMHHANIRETIVVTTDRLIALSVQGMNNPVFGLRSPITVYPTVDEAIAHAREQMVSA